jgi:predicted Fe-S protein YdhL (DUF1289 family)
MSEHNHYYYDITCKEDPYFKAICTGCGGRFVSTERNRGEWLRVSDDTWRAIKREVKA